MTDEPKDRKDDATDRADEQDQVEDLDVPESESEDVKGGRTVYEWWQKIER